ncbi:MAG: serine--tRNA ligase [Acholeplasmatales bacterium]|nr:serine--tRNA ligase [Acholeplasmatales bacterium]
MLDLKFVIENLEEVKKKLSSRNGEFSYLDDLVSLSAERKEVIFETETKKAQKNDVSKQIGINIKKGVSSDELIFSSQSLSDSIKLLDSKLLEIEQAIKKILETIPNIPDSSIPIGIDSNYNREERKYLEPKKFSFPIKDHTELGEKLGILDFERAAKITGARFVVDKGLGARLERSLIQFMMDLHSNEFGFTEIIPPYIINGDSLYGTGQFPKFKDDVYKLSGGDDNFDLYLNPTAEVPTINLYRDEIIPFENLPIKHVAYTAAFRVEAGSAGRDTRGILRQHQFNKVELIKLTTPESSYTELEHMLSCSEEVLKRLNLPYRVVTLCTGDLGFAAAKTYDIEVWIPSQNTYREIGSISNDVDFQARRANIRFKRTKDAKTEYVHTLNGSGLAVGRTMIAIIENYQNEDGSITIPDVLVPYMKVNKIC